MSSFLLIPQLDSIFLSLPSALFMLYSGDYLLAMSLWFCCIFVEMTSHIVCCCIGSSNGLGENLSIERSACKYLANSSSVWKHFKFSLYNLCSLSALCHWINHDWPNKTLHSSGSRVACNVSFSLVYCTLSSLPHIMFCYFHQMYPFIFPYCKVYHKFPPWFVKEIFSTLLVLFCWGNLSIIFSMLLFSVTTNLRGY